MKSQADSDEVSCRRLLLFVLGLMRLASLR